MVELAPHYTSEADEDSPVEDIALRAEAQSEVRQQQYEELIAAGMENKVLAQIMLGEVEATAGTSAAEEEDNEEEDEQGDEEDMYTVGRCRLDPEADYVRSETKK